MNIIITESQLSLIKESIDYKPGVKKDRLTKIVRKMSNRQEPLSRRATHDEFNDSMFFPSGPDQRKEKPKHLKDKELKQREDDKKMSMDEDDVAYGSENIRNLYDKLGDDEDVNLNDYGGTLYGHKVSKKEYVTNMLHEAIAKKDWGMVHRAIKYIETKFK